VPDEPTSLEDVYAVVDFERVAEDVYIAIANTSCVAYIVPMAPELAPLGFVTVSVVLVDATQRNVPLFAAVANPVNVIVMPTYPLVAAFVMVPVYTVVAVPPGPNVPDAAATDETVLVPVNTEKL
jgi:hypothetical protein